MNSLARVYGICLQLLPVISGLLPFIEIGISTGFPVIKPISGNKNDSSLYDIYAISNVTDTIPVAHLGSGIILCRGLFEFRI